jgi:hypothetical protein
MADDAVEKKRLNRLFRGFLVVLMLGGILSIVYGLVYTKLVCQKPYTAIDGECCLDRNVNGICDGGECLPEVTYARNSSGHCVEFTSTCILEGFSKVDSCPPASCFDGVENCHDGACETGIDCGGPCTVQVIATCLDGIQNQNETGVDCGGPCPPCILKKPKPTCFDGIQNQNETGVDCGGPCPPCLPTCSDGIKNQGEENVDCGGPCPSCISQPKDKLICSYNTTEKINDVGISSNGSIIVFGGEDDYVYALNSTGRLLWKYKTRGNVEFIGVSDNGLTTMAGSDDNYVYAFRNTTRVLPATSYYKRYQLGELKAGDVASNGYAVAAGAAYNENVSAEGAYREDYIYKLNNNADVISRYATEREVTKASISPSGSLAAGISDDRLFINGRVIEMEWLYTFDYLEMLDASESAVAVGNTNNVYYISGDKVQWIYNTTETEDISMSNNNHILVGDVKAVLLDGSMNTLWSYDAGYNAIKVALSRSGNVAAVFFENRYLYVFDGSGNLKWKYFTGDRITSMEISPTDDYIAAGSHSGALYLFKV